MISVQEESIWMEAQAPNVSSRIAEFCVIVREFQCVGCQNITKLRQ